ncbi:hypothetical protein NBO_41g0037 [Nosema bombycis CQ1]|uniref:Uncharacterized protein n=1 Tax=Nosema bombycis (strain CQ1 / CVCC 102059) TaxID=578461 RepID=R0KV16_NOSB1|nr:hypothetical protein NBO_41g0037 [Nosema bombycis CQ1]|eukprot:EOB14062.1 hypothetical protein NBO_41g0037 [Nosema bombycis CQ1]
MEDEDIKRIEEERKKKINFEMRNRHTKDFKINNEMRQDYGGYHQSNFGDQSPFSQREFRNQPPISQGFQAQNTNQGFYSQSTYQNHPPTSQGLNAQGFHGQRELRDQPPISQNTFRDQPLISQGFHTQGFHGQSANQGYNTQVLHGKNTNKGFHDNQSFHDHSLSLPLPVNLDNTLHSIPTNITYSEPSSYSLKLSPFYLSNFIFRSSFHQIENAIRQEAQHAISDQILKLKIEINKRLNQVNNDPDKVEMIGNMLKIYSNNHIFIDIFTCKFIEQSTVQISRNLDLNRPFGHLFKKVFTNSLFDFYKASVIKKSGDGPALKGVYGGFFGVLIEMDFVDELWAFGAGLLNGEYNENTFVVLEVYLIVGGEYLMSKNRRQYEKLQRYIKKNVLHEIKDKALKFRIGSLV